MRPRTPKKGLILLNTKPIIINFVWVGSKPSEEIYKTVDLWRDVANHVTRLHTSYSAKGKWYSEATLNGRHWAQIADVIRLDAFSKDSGWYADVDCQPGYFELVNLTKPTFFRTEPNLLGNGFFFMNKNSKFLSCWQEEILAGLTMTDCTIAEATGPGALTRAVYIYAINNGIQTTRNDLHLADYNFFLHWPAQFKEILGHLPARVSRGKYATHIANASWDLSAYEASPKFSLIKGIIWRLRNSQLDFWLGYLRFMATSRLKLQQRLTKTACLAVSSLSAGNLRNTTDLVELVQHVKSQDDLKLAVADLGKAFVVCNDPFLIKQLEHSGWNHRTLRLVGSVWVRPRLAFLLGRSPRIH
jgi:mannosyltransferase OCH1-like enzyme